MHQSTSPFHDLVSELARIRFLTEEGPASLFRLYQHYSNVFIHATETSQLHFSTLFARMSFALSRQSYPGMLKYHLHHFRVQVEQDEDTIIQMGEEGQKTLFAEGKWALIKFLEEWQGEPVGISPEIAFEPEQFTIPARNTSVTFHRQMKVIVTGAGELQNTLRGIEESRPEEEVIISYGHIGRNDIFSRDIQAAFKYPGLPFTLQLVDVEVETDGVLVPKIIVLEPDLLLDVSTVAECTTDLNQPQLIHVLRKFLPVETNPAILMGSVANHFLDTLIHNPERQFGEVFRDSFHIHPLAFSILSDADIVEMMGKAKAHFSHLKRVIRDDFPRLRISRQKCIIEPSFYAPAFGLQGRLDLYHEPGEASGKADIIELKSGKLFRPNNYGLNINHYTQTLLYDLLIKAVSEFRQKNNCYILYSAQKEKTLKFAPPVESLQKEAIHTRNQIVVTESFFQKATTDQLHVFFSRIAPENHRQAKGYHQANIQHFHEVYTGLSPGEQIYFNLFSGFIAREFALSKVGEQGIESVNGLASLWLDSAADKEQKYSIYRHLRLKSLTEEGNESFVSLDLNQSGDALTNFRIGDIAVLYPDAGKRQDILRHQIFKCTLVEIRADSIYVKLRNNQVNRRVFEKYTYWNLEHDMLDSGFTRQYQSLFTFARQHPVARSIFLGSIPPGKPVPAGQIPSYPGMLPDQARVLKKMIEAKDYFLLWGPPGTGKTSIMIRYAVEYYLRHTDQNILLVAYTNRAVDEICAAVDEVGDDVRMKYTRFGSRVGTAPRYRGQLFRKRTSSFTKRKEVTTFLAGQRIIIGTISSLIGNEELLQLKEFNIAIVDEASQILEPMLAGLLPRVGKKILIGDHRQLPAVVLQSPADTKVDDKRMHRLSMTDMRDSYFERMYRLCNEKSWDWAFDRLAYQGRMHREIMDIANDYFYKGSLKLINARTHSGHDQEGDLKFHKLPEGDTWLIRTIQNRMAFIPAEVDDIDLLHKTNQDEAQICVSLIKVLQETYALNGIPWDQKTLGVITPFRAQIALIRQKCQEADVGLDHITIDTVERYQGSARDIIILSTAVTSPSQLAHIVAENRENVDRKLNVSLTRARKQFFITGDAETLRRNKTYRALIDAYSI